MRWVMSRKMNIAIIVAGGSGMRFGGEIPKQFVKVNGKEIIEHCVETFSGIEKIDKIVIACNEKWIAHTQELFAENKKISVICGGQNRFNSSFNGLKCIHENGWIHSNVLIHDAARPFVSEEIIENCVANLERFSALTVSVPIFDTIVMAKDGFVEKVLDRSKLFGNQTPQCFWFETIWSAYNCAKNDEFTDDISVVLANCGKVRILDGDFKNKKITKIEDILQNETRKCPKCY